MTDQYAVIGQPVDHSRSPAIHAAFAKQTGETIAYERLPAPLDDFAETASAFLQNGGRGLNVTLPFKGQACAFVDNLTERARNAQAVNTIAVQADGRTLGDNTDGAGLVRDLCHNQGLSLEPMRVLMLGAGGAVQGVLGPLLALAPQQFVIANRTAEKAAALARPFGDSGDIHGIGLDAIGDYAPFDLIINGTAASLAGDLPPLPDHALAPQGVAYDMLYANEPTHFMRWAQAHGAGHSADGFGMLVEQAAESFSLWRGVQPETRPVITALRPGAPSAA